MSIVITGWRSQISQELIKLLPKGENPVHGKPCETGFSHTADRYFFCHGLLRPIKAADQTDEEKREGLEVNFLSIVKHVDLILEWNPKARICVIGSHSGYAGSYDGVYADAKDRLHDYIESMPIRFPAQQLVGIAPSIIADTKMTMSRKDQDRLKKRRLEHPKKRWLQAAEVARLSHFLLYIDEGYITNTVIRMHGGQV